MRALPIVSRVLGGLAVLAVLLVALSWAGFRLWLRGQPEQTRATVEAFSTLELLAAARAELFPPEPVDRAGFGRRLVPGRGHAPWILRSSLDGRPRMLQLALAPGIWLSYGTEIASLYQLWRGELELTGAVYDTRHGPEPVSMGTAWLRQADETDWRVGDAVPEVRYLGHGVDPASGRAYLRSELSRAGTRAVVRESPELVHDGERLGLERRFVVEARSGAAEVALLLRPGAEEIAIEGGAAEPDGVVLGDDETVLVQWLGEPGLPIARRGPNPRLPVSPAEAALRASDCVSCHQENERVVGPAWSEVALRYAAEDPTAAVRKLTTSILAGSVGAWGQVPMPGHPELSRAQAGAIARHVLAATPEAAPAGGDDAEARARWRWSYEVDVEPRPKGLHPALRVARIRPDAFTPKVGGLALLPDGALLVATWDRDGAVFRVEGWARDGGEVSVVRIAEGLHEPLGLAVAGDDVYVMQKQEISRLVDLDGDGWTDEYQAVSRAWETTSNFHEFGFGLVHHEGFLHGTLSVCVLPGGSSCPEQTPHRGRAFRVSLGDGRLEWLARGFRTPNGVGWLAGHGLLVTDNQGDWLPASKLLLARPGSFHGWRGPREAGELPETSPPIVWLPQNEVGNSPTQPLVLRTGPYAGQVVFGDVYNGGLKRVALDEVDGRLQGAAFHFTAGLEGGVNRLLEAPDGSLLAGEIGSTGNWGDLGKEWYGLERLRFGETPAFEPFAVRATAGGFDVELTAPLAAGSQPGPGDVTLRDWFYVPASRYGGPKFDPRELRVRAVRLSPDRRVLSLDVDGLETGRVVYLRLDRALRSEQGESLWVNEAWYTLNALPGRP